MEGAIFRHYKGNDYVILHIGIHTETEERLVVYRSLKDLSTVWVRPYDMFFGTLQVDGVEVKRFTQLL
jgi:hypothetical protein